MAEVVKESEYRIKVDTAQASAGIKQLGSQIQNTSKQFDNCTKTAQGVTGAFQSVASVVSLMGGESEAASEAIMKMQQVMQITNGFKMISDGKKAMLELNAGTKIASKGMGTLKKAIVGTGIGALVVLVGALVTNWDNFKESLGMSTAQLNKFGDTFRGVLGVVNGGLAGIAKALGRLVKGDFKGAWQEIKDGFNVAETFRSGYNKRAREEAEALAEEEAERLKEKQEAYQKLYESLLDKYKDYGKSQRQILKETLEEELRLAGKNAELRKKIRQKYADEIRKLDEEDAAKRAEAEAKALEEEISSRDKALQAVMQSLAAEQMALDDKYLNGLMSREEYDKAVEDLDKEYNDRYIAMIQEQLAMEEITTDERIALIDKLNAARMKQIESMVVEAEVEQTSFQKFEDQMASINEKASAVGGAMSDLFGAVAENLDENSEEYKAIMITQAVITTLMGVINAVSSAMSPANEWMTIIGQSVYAATMSAAVIATGAASIAKMASANEHTSIGGASMPSAGAVNQLQTPRLQAQTQGDSERKSKVYVTETDITQHQNKRNRMNAKVSF